MTSSADSSAFIDPFAQKLNRNPYLVLSKLSLTHQSSMKEVNDASFELMAEGMSAKDREAWDELRLTQRRLAIDFFMYMDGADHE